MDSKHKKKYLAYLGSDEWNDIRIDMLELNDHKCEQCGSTRSLQVHHLTYENLFYEEPDDLALLCGSCHRIAHGKSPKKNRKNNLRPKGLHVIVQRFYGKYGKETFNKVKTWRDMWHFIAKEKGYTLPTRKKLTEHGAKKRVKKFVSL